MRHYIKADDALPAFVHRTAIVEAKTPYQTILVVIPY